MTPLLDRKHPMPFTHAHAGGRLAGIVYPQYLNQHRKDKSHPDTFYVVFPDDAIQPTFEISARKLLAILGDGHVARSFTRLELARTLERIPATFDLRQLLARCQPA